MRIVDNPNGKEYGEAMSIIITPPTKEHKDSVTKSVNKTTSKQVGRIKKLQESRKGKKFVNGRYV